MATESTNGKMVKFIKVNGLTDLRVDPESGEVPKEILTLVNGKTAKLMGMVYTPGSMATDIKANSSNALNMEKESKNLPMVTLTEVPTKTANPMATVSIFGVMAVHTKVSLRRVSETVKEFGKNQVIPTLIPTMVSFSTKKSKAMVSLHGQTAANTWVISLTMSGKVMAKCTGVMETYTKANGTTEPKLRKSHNPSI
jgi:hypothetical protein